MLNSSQIEEIKYSLIAERLGYETAEIFLDWIQGKQEPTFTELRKIADFLGVNQDWLVHGYGHPTPHSFFEVIGNPEIDIPKLFLTTGTTDQEIFLSEIKKNHFVRSLSDEGELLIIREQKNGLVEVLETRAHISTSIGEGGRITLQSFARLWKALYDSSHRSLIDSYLINSSKFNQIREFDIHPLSIIHYPLFVKHKLLFGGKKFGKRLRIKIYEKCILNSGLTGILHQLWQVKVLNKTGSA